MSQVTLHGIPIKIGDKIWSIQYGWLTVTYTTTYSEYPIIADKCSFTENGYYSRNEESPSLFWKEQEFDLSKPLPDLKMDAKVIVWNDDDKTKHTKHFSHFDEQGKINCFSDGRTSWTDMGIRSWDNYEVVEESND